MSGTYQAWNEDAPGGGAESRAAVAAGLAEAYAAVGQDQRDARGFIEAHGADVTAGHPTVRRPGRQGDPDSFGPDAGDL